MIGLPTHSRAARWAAVPALGFAALVCACPAQAFKPTAKSGSENQPLNLSSTASTAHASSGGPSIVRTIVGLLIVIAVIWGLAWILRQVKSGRETRAAGSGLTSLATLPLGAGRTLHLVRAGREYLLLGSAEHGVVPIHRYSEQQARDTGLLDIAGESINADSEAGVPGVSVAGTRARAIQMPGQRRAPGGAPATNLVERLREWTVRR
jgi:flagellar protein FliO/FliZ